MIESPTRSGSIVFISAVMVVRTRACARTRSVTATWWCGSTFPAREASAPLGMRIQTVGVCSKESGMESSSIFNGEPSQKSTNGLWEDAFKPLTQLKTVCQFVHVPGLFPVSVFRRVCPRNRFFSFRRRSEARQSRPLWLWLLSHP